MQFSLLYFILSLIPAGLAATGYYYEKNHQTQPTNQHLQYASPPRQHNHRYSPGPASYEKEYFYFSAPEEDPSETESLNKLLNSVKKRRQVIFVQTPMNAAYEKALEKYLQDSVERQTHIYVFSQKQNLNGLLQRFQNLPKTIHHKPEVHFVKYKNPADIQSIQSSIIDQFGAASESKPVYSLPPTGNNAPVSKNYAMNFLPAGIDVVPGSSYIPLFLF